MQHTLTSVFALVCVASMTQFLICANYSSWPMICLMRTCRNRWELKWAMFRQILLLLYHLLHRNHPLLQHLHKSMMILLLKRDLINLRTSRKVEVEVALLLVLQSPTSCLTADTQSVFAIHQGSGGKCLRLSHLCTSLSLNLLLLLPPHLTLKKWKMRIDGIPSRSSATRPYSFPGIVTHNAGVESYIK